MDGKKVAICATVADLEERKFTSKKTGEVETFCKITLQQNNDMTEMILWPEEYYSVRDKLLNAKGKMIACMAYVKWSDYAKSNNLQISKRNLIEII